MQEEMVLEQYLRTYVLFLQMGERKGVKNRIEIERRVKERFQWCYFLEIHSSFQGSHLLQLGHSFYFSQTILQTGRFLNHHIPLLTPHRFVTVSQFKIHTFELQKSPLSYSYNIVSYFKVQVNSQF